MADDVTVTIPRGHVVMLLRLIEREARARRKRVARSRFTPEPGRMNANAATAEALEGVAERLRVAMAGPGEGRNG